jgi:hypothetical protein
LVKLVPKEMPEPRETLAYPAPLGPRVKLALLVLAELKAILAARAILGLPELLELPEQRVPLAVPDRLGRLALLVLAVRPEPLVAVC